jgi:hypothetical protein
MYRQFEEKNEILTKNSKALSKASQKLIENDFYEILKLQQKSGEADTFSQYLYDYKAKLYKELEEKNETKYIGILEKNK